MSARIYFLMYINPSVINVWIFCQWCQDTNHTNFLSYPMKWTLATHYHDHFPHLCHAMWCDHGAGRDAIVLHHGTCRFQKDLVMQRRRTSATYTLFSERRATMWTCPVFAHCAEPGGNCQALPGGSEASMKELIILVSEYPDLYNTALAWHKDNQKKNWAWGNISTKSQVTGILPKYVRIFGAVSYCLRTQLLVPYVYTTGPPTALLVTL